MKEEIEENRQKISVLEMDKQCFIEKLKDETVLQIDKDNYRKYLEKANEDIKKLSEEYLELLEKQCDSSNGKVIIVFKNKYNENLYGKQ